MRVFTVLLILISISAAKKPFTPDYFINKHNLKLPEITGEMLDISNHTHRSDLWEYFYVGTADTLDSVYNFRTLQAYHDSKHFEIYSYSLDTTIINIFSIAQDNGDTTNKRLQKITENGKRVISIDLKRNCTWYHKKNEWGKRIYEKLKCPGDKKPRGQEFEYTDHGEYIEAIPFKRGKVDSNNIRRYYFTAYNSIVADYLVEKQKTPFLVELHLYKDKKPATVYEFSIFDTLHPIVNIYHYTYNKAGKQQKNYFLTAVDWKNPKKGYELANYTEYEYDTLGRKVKASTWVVPDPEYDTIVPREGKE